MKKWIVGNWKMFKTPAEARRDFINLTELTRDISSQVDMGIAAPTLALDRIAEGARSSHLSLLAQNAHWEAQGAFTGEVSVPMLASLSLQGSLVAHSERRQMFGENNIAAGRRVAGLLRAGLNAVYCVGETLAERESGKLEIILRTQLFEALHSGSVRAYDEVVGSDPDASKLAIAYEPVWAIGTGKAATVKEAGEAHALIRGILTEHFGADVARCIRILYGGSVKTSNIRDFTSVPHVDGALVGGASLKPDEFAELCRKAI